MKKAIIVHLPPFCLDTLHQVAHPINPSHALPLLRCSAHSLGLREGHAGSVGAADHEGHLGLRPDGSDDEGADSLAQLLHGG